MTISPRKIEEMKARTVRRCANCRGFGCPSCYRYCAFIDRMAEAGIPVDYWMRRIKSWHGDPNFIKKLESRLSDINLMFEKGRILCLVGHRGVGKTMAAKIKGNGTFNTKKTIKLEVVKNNIKMS